MKAIAPMDVDFYIEKLNEAGRNLEYIEIEGILTFSASYLKEMKRLQLENEELKQALKMLKNEITWINDNHEITVRFENDYDNTLLTLELVDSLL